MKEFKRYSAEQIEQANNADIVSYAQTHFQCEKAGKEIHIKGYGGLYVNPETNAFYRHSENIGGKGLLEFCKKILDMPFLKAMRECVGEAAEVKQFTPKAAERQTEQEKKEFVMPEKSENGYKNIYAYFINTRSISPETVREFVNKGLIYPTVSKGVSKTTGNEYQKINAAFLHKNEQGQPCGADIQGIDQNPEYRFKGCTARDESDRGFVYNKGDVEKIDTVYLFEAPIDLMSFVELHPEIENAKFAALSGLKPSTAEPYINSGLKVVSCVDNDTAGINFNNRILFSKMQENIGGENVKSHTVQNGDISINFCSAEVNGKDVSFFLTKEDCFAAKELGAEVSKVAVSWINRSNFTVNRECAEAGVKDFNDLLKKTKAAENEISPLDNTEKFIERVNEIADWAEKATNKAMERLNDSRQENVR
ncbi:MAG: DUF3991 and toprim domain-containing protein [Ruminococcus sp.]|nr:DUF3991 and toprim domain-containing protein [Ruminococcus sp.]